MALAIVAAALGGLIIGSFLNVVAYRLPRGESLSRPRSRCPGCEAPIKPYDNVPVLSWLLLRGQCRKCGEGMGAHVKKCKCGGLRKYVGLLVHDMRRSAARNLRRAGVSEGTIMQTGGWRTRSMLDRYNIQNRLDQRVGGGRVRLGQSLTPVDMTLVELAIL